MSFADLHIHSNASDGICPPSSIAPLASEAGFPRAIALTDHDNLSGLSEACASCSQHGISFVPGVEITTRHDGRAVHMLGYFIDDDDVSLGEFLRENRQRRERRVLEMAERLAADGYPVSADELLAMGETPSRPLLARALVARGCAGDTNEAFARLLNSSSPYYVEALYPEALEAIELIGQAGGYAFVAHPARYGIIDLVETFARSGMTGLEAFHTKHAPSDAVLLVELATHLGLAVSGGSDWHGDDVHHARLGGAGLDEDGYIAFLRACERM